jgi:long-subunit acyl-CoA synthetase (AMP-forming)
MELTFPNILLANAEKFASRKDAIREKDYGIWQSYSWTEYLEQVKSFALGLAALGFKRGDKTAIIGDNRPQLYWSMVATQCLGGIPVPLFQDAIEDEMHYRRRNALRPGPFRDQIRRCRGSGTDRQAFKLEEPMPTSRIHFLR